MGSVIKKSITVLVCIELTVYSILKHLVFKWRKQQHQRQQGDNGSWELVAVAHIVTNLGQFFVICFFCSYSISTLTISCDQRYYSPTGHGRRWQRTYRRECEDNGDVTCVVLISKEEASQVISYERLHGSDRESRELEDARRLARNPECGTSCPWGAFNSRQQRLEGDCCVEDCKRQSLSRDVPGRLPASAPQQETVFKEERIIIELSSIQNSIYFIVIVY